MIEATLKRIRSTRSRIEADPELQRLERLALDEDDPVAARSLLDTLGIPAIAGADGSGDDEEEEEEEEEDGDDDDGDDDDETISKAEAARLRKRADEQEARARKAEKKLADQRRKEGESEGDFERLYNEERKKNEALEKAIENGERASSAVEIATRLKFRNPRHAVKLISEEAMESADAQERALRALAREEPSYVKKSQAPPSGDGDGDDGKGSSSGNNGDGGDGENGSGEKPKTFGVGTIRQAYAEAEAANNGGSD